MYAEPPFFQFYVGNCGKNIWLLGQVLHFGRG